MWNVFSLYISAICLNVRMMEVVYFQYKNGCGQIRFSLFLLNVLIIPLMVVQTALIIQDWVLNLSGVELCKIDANRRQTFIVLVSEVCFV